MNTIELTITNIHERGFAFGVNEDTAEQCFIPPHVLDGADVSRGDSVTAQVVPNPNEKQRDNTRWCAINLAKAEHSEKPKAKNKVLEDKLYNFMENTRYTYTFEMAAHLGVTPAHAEELALTLFNGGCIAKADVYEDCNHKRPSFTLWSADADFFLEADQ